MSPPLRRPLTFPGRLFLDDNSDTYDIGLYMSAAVAAFLAHTSQTGCSLISPGKFKKEATSDAQVPPTEILISLV